MLDLTEQDHALVAQAQEVIRKNYDGVKYFHVVGAALRCKDGTVYRGVDIFSVHGACAEYTAMGTAITEGAREFDCIVAVGGDNLDQVYSPCGNCRQLLLTYMPDGYVIVNTQQGLKKISVKELIPYAYHVK